MKSEKGFMYLLIGAEVIVLIMVILFGAVKHFAMPKEQTEVQVSTQNNQIEQLPEDTEETTELLQPETEEESVTVTFSEEVEAMLSEMSLEEKVAQLFIVSPETLTGAERVTIAGNGTRDALEEYPVGDILYARRNYLGQVQMRDMLRGAQEMSHELSGRYLFVGALTRIGEATVIINVPVGQEEEMAGIITATNLADNHDIENMEHILYVQEQEALPQERNEEQLSCYNVTNGAPSAVEAMNAGADMLCVIDGFTNVYDAVLEAVENGEISEETLRVAVGRILTRKQTVSE